MDLPDPESLRCFVAAARLSSFKAAARTVGLTAAAVGQRIARLEEQTQRPLFQRFGRRVALAEAGAAFLPAAERALSELSACLRVGRGEAGPAPEEIVIGTRYELGMSWITPALKPLRRALPHVTFHLYFGSGSDLLLRVRGQDIHCAVGSMRSLDPHLSTAQLHREDYVLVGHRQLLASTPLNAPAQAAAHVLIDADATLPLFAYFRDGPRAQPLPFRGIVYMGTGAAIRQAVLDGQGVAVLPKYFVAADLRQGRLRVLLPRLPPLSDHFRLYFRAQDPRRALYETIASTLRGLPLR